MGRPAPDIILTGREGNRTLDILLAADCYAVLCRGEFMATRSTGKQPNDIQYGRVTFAHMGHAIRLMEKLNQMFDTNDFTVEPLRVK